MTTDFRFALEPLTSPDALALEWRALEGETSFFLTWDWIGLWLEMLPQALRPMLLALLSLRRKAHLVYAHRRCLYTEPCRFRPTSTSMPTLSRPPRPAMPRLAAPAAWKLLRLLSDSDAW